MAIALRRSVYSTNIKTRADFSCAFFDRELRPVAQAFTQPVHLGSLTILTPRAVGEYGPENLAPGDYTVLVEWGESSTSLGCTVGPLQRTDLGPASCDQLTGSIRGRICVGDHYWLSQATVRK